MPVTHQQAAHHLLDRAHMLAEVLHEMHKRSGKGCGQQERNAKPQAVGREQDHALLDVFLGAGNGQNGGKHGAYAWCPAKCEGKADEIGSEPIRRGLRSTLTRASR